MNRRGAVTHNSLIGIGLAALVTAALVVPTTAVAQNSARAHVSVTVIQGARALTDSVIKREFRLFLADRRSLTRAPPRRPPTRRVLPGRGPEGLIAVRIRADTASRLIRMDVEYVGTD